MLVNFFYLIFPVLGLLFSNLYAESPLTCPSITSVHQLHNIWPHGSWLPLYVSNDELAMPSDISEFSQNTTKLIRAEWSGDFLEAGHCFYEGNTKVMLARDMLKPNLKDYPSWQLVTSKLIVCTSANEDACPFGGLG